MNEPAGRKTPESLSPTLRSLVGVVEAALGEVIAEAEGAALFDVVEGIRRQMVRVRDGTPDQQTEAMAAARSTLRALSPAERDRVARAYTIYLELVNLCENAYRTHRLRGRERDDPRAGSGSGGVGRMVFVLTAHPTESRSPTNIKLMRQAQDLCVDALEHRRDPDRARLKHLLHLVWRTGTHPPHKPTVEDEARHMFSLVSDPIIAELIQLQRRGHVVFLRTWVGGDKDGHPGVGPEETDRSLNLSRSRLLSFIRGRILPDLEAHIVLIDDGLRPHLESFARHIESLRQVTIGDGRRLVLLRDAARAFAAEYASRRGAAHPSLRDMESLLELFPGLVIPLELREERGLFTPGSPIAHMLQYVRDVARGGRVEWYARGLVVSMTDKPQDLLEAQALVVDVVGEPSVPVIPLFEMPDVLPRAPQILSETLDDPAYREQRHEDWGLEVMLGYSDTSKRMGVLASRLAIHDAMAAIGVWGEERGIDVVFFHGSGGSEGRGGGTIEERFATWPPGASQVVKQTLQGEMIERTLATPEILRSQVEKIAQNQAAPPEHREPSALTRELAARAQAGFVEVVGAPEFHDLLGKATPYARLGALNIGSRPVSRSGKSSNLESLRAIPWVLCWTQTRYLLHAWLGTGVAWRALREARAEPRGELLSAIREDPLLRSYLRVLGFTLAKTAPAIWREYVSDLVGVEGLDASIVARLEQEREDALDLAQQSTEDGELLSYRPWLRESIRYRAPMIHPLNLLQIEVLEHEGLSEEQELLFRETVTGVAAGMLTTG